jgi:hypothetical protein
MNKLFLKLAIGIIVVFGLLTLVFYLWIPLKIRYYRHLLYSDDSKDRIQAVDGLLTMGEKGMEVLTSFCGSQNATDLLVEGWENPDGRSGENDFLDVAVLSGHFNVVILFLDKGIEGYPIDCIDGYPLYRAVIKNNIKIADLLIRRGADINGDMSDAPIHLASSKEMISFLLARGADINEQGIDGYTPLHNASLNGAVELASILIEKGADINTRGFMAETALDLAKNDNIRELLRKHGAKTGAELRARRK